MGYRLVVTDEMSRLLDKCVSYLLYTLKNEQAARHLLDSVSEVYDNLENNPEIYRLSEDPFLRSLCYHEAKVPNMEYLIIYKILERTVFLLGIFHTLENYTTKVGVVRSRTDL